MRRAAAASDGGTGNSSCQRRATLWIFRRHCRRRSSSGRRACGRRQRRPENRHAGHAVVILGWPARLRGILEMDAEQSLHLGGPEPADVPQSGGTGGFVEDLQPAADVRFLLCRPARLASNSAAALRMASGAAWKSSRRRGICGSNRAKCRNGSEEPLMGVARRRQRPRSPCSTSSIGHRRTHRQAQNLAMDRFGDGQGAFAQAKMRIGGLKMRRDRVVDRRAHARGPLAVRRRRRGRVPHDEQMPYRLRPGLNIRQRQIAVRESPPGSARRSAADGRWLRQAAAAWP